MAAQAFANPNNIAAIDI